MSKFVMLDRFAKTLGLALAYPGMSVAKTALSVDDLGNLSRVRIVGHEIPIFG